MAINQDILDAFKEIEEASVFEVFVPFLKRNIKFKQLNTKQYKQLIETVIDSPIYNTQFIISCNNIIKDNCIEEIDTNDLTILDKTIILYMMRIKSISSAYLIDDTLVNLTDNYNNFINSFTGVEPKTFTHDSYSVTCYVPTLTIENQLEEELHKNIKIKLSSTEEIRAVLGETFINEITKYITNLKIKDKEIVFQDLDFKTRIQIVEQLPTSVITSVLKYIEDYKNIISKLTIFTVNGSEKEIPLDASFLNI